jgi:hypothetical protein
MRYTQKLRDEAAQRKEQRARRDRLILMQFDILGMRLKEIALIHPLSESSIKRIIYKERKSDAEHMP